MTDSKYKKLQQAYREKSRAEKAGYNMGLAVVEMVHLMYQKNTATNFWKGMHRALLSYFTVKHPLDKQEIKI